MKTPARHCFTPTLGFQTIRDASAALGLGIFLWLALAAPGRAATVTWGAPTTISNASDVVTTGSLLYAYSFTETGVATTAVNGVTFETFALGQAFAPVTVGNATMTPNAGLDGKDTGLGSGAAPFINLPATYRTLLSRGMTELSGQLTLTIGGLTVGNSYLVQFWSNGSPTLFFNGASSNAKTLYTAGNSVTLDLNSTNADGGVGQWVTGTFQASATTQTVSLGVASGNFLVLNAFQLRTAVPEPSATVLLTASGLVLLGSRRRRA